MRKWIIIGAATIVVIAMVGIVSTMLTKNISENESEQTETESIPYDVSGIGRTDEVEVEGLPELT